MSRKLVLAELSAVASTACLQLRHGHAVKVAAALKAHLLVQLCMEALQPCLQRC